MKTEIIKGQPFAVCMERSYVNCLVQGLRHGVENAGTMWKNFWPLFVASALLPFPFTFFAVAAILIYMPAWAQDGHYPRIKLGAQGRTIWRGGLRYMAFAMVIALVITIVAALTLMALGFYPLWIGLVVAVIVCIAILPLQWGKMQLLFGGKSIAESFKGYGTGLRHMGQLFPFYLLLSLLSGVVCLVASAPFIVSLAVIGQMSTAQQMGDAAYVPVIFWLLLVASQMVMLLVAFYLQTLVAHAEFLLWGSIQAIEKEQG